MDIHALVEQITNEVLQTLNTAAAPGPGAPSSARTKSPPAERLEPVRPPQGGGTGAPPSGSSPSPASLATLILVGAGEDEIAGFEAQAGRLLEQGACRILASKQAMERIRRAIGPSPSPILYYEEERDPGRVLAGVQRVVAPAFSISQLAGIASLTDPWILESLQRGRPVTVVNALPAGSPLQFKVDAFVADLAKAGVTVQPLAAAAAAAAASPPSHPAQAAGRHDTRPHACQQETEGECGGLGFCTKFIPDRVKTIMECGADRVSTTLGNTEGRGDIGRFIDHTLLKADATREQVIELCEEARQYSFASVCINPSSVKLASDCLQGSPVKVCTVIGFPLGATTSVTKAIETRDAIANGADEIDMVMNVGALKAGQYDLVEKDIKAVVAAAAGKLVKVILETALLTDEEKVTACQLAKAAGADYVKTSTGFGPGGATAKDIALMRQTVGKYMGVKASGGIRDLETARAMIDAGATRIGASASVAIVKGEAAAGPSKGY